MRQWTSLSRESRDPRIRQPKSGNPRDLASERAAFSSSRPCVRRPLLPTAPGWLSPEALRAHLVTESRGAEYPLFLVSRKPTATHTLMRGLTRKRELRR
jgi:hypothetical protein